MNKCLKCLVFLLVLSLFSTKSDTDLLTIPTSNSLSNSNLSQLIQSNNDNAVQIEPQNHIIENPNFSNNFKLFKKFSKFNSTSLQAKELFFSFLTRLNEKILNSTLLFFSNIQIIFPFHSFW